MRQKEGKGGVGSGKSKRCADEVQRDGWRGGSGETRCWKILLIRKLEPNCEAVCMLCPRAWPYSLWTLCGGDVLRCAHSRHDVLEHP